MMTKNIKNFDNEVWISLCGRKDARVAVALLSKCGVNNSYTSQHEPLREAHQGISSHAYASNKAIEVTRTILTISK